ncbi:hypothetical protein COB52_00625 [Candidatus Kaiserbacteria bacterium]|nr:MAG: hypothetical protein COB52_00625 [Candidatus Kaiserbacteria bacterium]
MEKGEKITITGGEMNTEGINEPENLGEALDNAMGREKQVIPNVEVVEEVRTPLDDVLDNLMQR